MNKRIVKISVIAVSVILLLLILCTVARHVVMVKIGDFVQKRIEFLGWTVEMDPAPIWRAPFCYDRVAFIGPKDSRIVLHDNCLNDGILSVFGHSPEISISTEELDGFIDWTAFDKLLALRDKKKDAHQDSEKRARLLNKLLGASVSYDVGHINLKLGIPGVRLGIKSDASFFGIKDGRATAQFSFKPSVNLAKALFAVASMPMVSVDFDMDMAAFAKMLKWISKPENEREKAQDDAQPLAKLKVTADPPIEFSYAWNDEPLQIKIAGMDADVAGKDLFSVGLTNLSMNMPNNETMGDVAIRRVAVAFRGIPSLKNFIAIQLTEPQVHLTIDALLASEKVLSNPLLGSLVRFWQKDAGSFLGNAPKLSVRREDVKKPKPKIKSNPIPKETLEKVKLAFNQFQKKIMALPAIDIQNGRIEIRHGEEVFALDAVSFNTAELFEDDQKFRLKFNLRDAMASFEVNYEGDSPFPTLALGLDKLRAQEFLSILNMPIPEKSDGTVSANLNLALDEDRFQLQGSMAFEKFAFFHEKISPNVIHDMNASLDLQVTYTFEDDKIAISPLSMTSGPVTVSGFFNISNVRSDPVIEFELGAKDVPCSDIPAAIPPGFLPTITDLQIAGTRFSPKLIGKIPWKNPLISTLKESGFEGKCFPISVAPHQPSILNDPKYTFTTDYTYFVDHITVGPGTREFTPLNRIPPYVRAAMLQTEDKRFFDHGPLRISFIERGLRLNLNQRKYVYGGSTISQQLAKNLFLDRRKNLARKLEEAFVAWRMENVVSKSRILELYINMIEFGPDVYGITQAAKFYFDKKPEDLTPLEGAYLASLKVSPSKGGKFYKNGFPNSAWWPKRMKYILKVLSENGYITPAEVIAAYPWVPQFVYPDPSDFRDERNVWLRNYGEYLLEQARAKKREEAEAKQAASDDE